MASTTPHCSITATKPYKTHQYPLNHRLISHQHVSLPNLSSFSPLCSLRPPKPDPLNAFSRRRPTRCSHLGRPKATVGPSRHSPPAVEALHSALQLGKDESSLETVLLSFESKLCGSDDYIYLLRELGNRGECWKAVRCFEFAVRRENSTTELEKLASSMVTTLAILGKFELAKNVFQTAVNEGYGNTVDTYSALISAYARNGHCDEAMDVFAEMKKAGLKADVALYSELIDALCKSGMVEASVSLLEEMAKEGIQPDVVTYNSMIDAIGRSATTEAAVDNGAGGIVLPSDGSSISEKDGEVSQEKVQNQVEDREGKFQGNSKLDKQHDLLYPLLFREYIYALAHDRDARYDSRFSLLIVKRLIQRMSSMY